MPANRLSVEFRGHTLALENVPCDFCGGTEFVPFWSKMRHGLDLETVFCASCSLCQTNPRPTPDANRLFYQRLYMSFHGNSSNLDSEYVTRSERIAAPRVDLLARVIGKDQPLTVFEVGAGAGQFQRLARERTSWCVSGIEPGKEQAGLCRRLGLDVENRFLEEVPSDAGPYDVVVSFHVFEHFLSPADFLRRVNRLLKPGGLLYLEVPNLASPGGPFTAFLQFPHLYSFTAITLRNYLTAIGGFRPVYTSEGRSDLAMMSRKVTEARADHPKAGEFEGYDLERFRRRMKVLERVFTLASYVPRLPVLEKVRATLFSV